FALYGFLASVSPGDAVKALFPISAYNYWFASVYMGLLLLTPFISMLAMRLTKAQYRWLLVCLAIFFSVNQMIFQVNAYGSYSGRELPWFIFLALLAGYIRLHTRQERKYFYYGLAGYILSSLAILASVYLSVELGLDEIGYFLNYNSPLALLSTACLFLAVKNMPWKETRVDGLIRKIASAAFGVYLIHDNYLIRYLVWDTFRASKVALTHWAVIYAAAVAVVVYVACTCIELLRQKLFAACGERYEKTSLYQKEQALCRRIDGIFTKTPA
ncbi:MAG: acyltransferase, partial [Lachnospiraceae bacterium]|nr:acyltransferase [Lachnospiraceae bacterium]